MLARRPSFRSSGAPPSLGAPGPTEDVNAGGGCQRAEGFEQRTVVVVPGDHNDLGAGIAKIENRAPNQALGVRGRGGRLEEIAGDEHEVDGLLSGDRGDLGEHLSLLLEAMDALEYLADMPVAGVQELHCSPSNGSPSVAGAIAL